jgi:hypothetical protein
LKRRRAGGTQRATPAHPDQDVTRPSRCR